jgi:hypothetical protein
MPRYIMLLKGIYKYKDEARMGGWVYCHQYHNERVYRLVEDGLIKTKPNKSHRYRECPWIAKLTDKGLKLAEKEIAMEALETLDV